MNFLFANWVYLDISGMSTSLIRNLQFQPHDSETSVPGASWYVRYCKIGVISNPI